MRPDCQKHRGGRGCTKVLGHEGPHVDVIGNVWSTAADFTPVTPEAAAGFLDAALFDGAPADDRLLDAWATIVAMGEPRECGAKASNVPYLSAVYATETWIPCQKPAGHTGEHYSTSGCAGGQVTWTDQPPPADLYRVTALIAKWEAAARAETDVDTFANGFLSGQNWAASELRSLLWGVEQAQHMDAWATIVAMGRDATRHSGNSAALHAQAVEQAEQIDGLKFLIVAIAQDWGDKCCDDPDDCACTMGQAIRFARALGVTE